MKYTFNLVFSLCLNCFLASYGFAQDSTFIKIVLPTTEDWKIESIVTSYNDEVFMEKFVDIYFEQEDTNRNEWSVKLNVAQPYKYFFGIDRKIYFDLLIFPNDTIKISFDETGKPTFLKGKTANEHQVTYNVLSDYTNYFISLNEKERDWKSYSEEVKDKKQKVLANYKIATKDFEANPVFEKYFHNELDVQTVQIFEYYTYSRKKYLKENNLSELPLEYYQQNPKLDVIMEDNFPYSLEYINYIAKQLSDENCKENEYSDTNEGNFCMYDYIETLKESKLKKLLFLNIIFNMASRTRWEIKEQTSEFESRFNKFKNNYPADDRIEFIEKKVEILKRFSKGQPVPNFSLRSKEGNLVSLTDFRGKYVLIDFWGTWCGPCIAEIPHSQKLESEFVDKDIAFVYISMRDNEEKWKKHVSDTKLKGTQLFADKEESEQLEKEYDVRFYPSFLLLDKEGKIVTRRIRPSYNGKDVLDQIFSEE